MVLIRMFHKIAVDSLKLRYREIEGQWLAHIDDMIEMRRVFRDRADYVRSDVIKMYLEMYGVEVMDFPDESFYRHISFNTFLDIYRGNL